MYFSEISIPCNGKILGSDTTYYHYNLLSPTPLGVWCNAYYIFLKIKNSCAEVCTLKPYSLSARWANLTDLVASYANLGQSISENHDFSILISAHLTQIQLAQDRSSIPHGGVCLNDALPHLMKSMNTEFLDVTLGMHRYDCDWNLWIVNSRGIESVDITSLNVYFTPEYTSTISKNIFLWTSVVQLGSNGPPGASCKLSGSTEVDPDR